MTFRLRNKMYSFCTNIMDDENPGVRFYEREICDLLNKQIDELKILEYDVKFSDRIGVMQEKRLREQAKHLKEIYRMIEKKDWKGLEVLYENTYQDYDDII